VQGYNESRLKSSLRKFYGRYNDLVCDYKLSLAHMLDDLFHSVYWTAIQYWLWRRVIPYTWFRLRAHGGRDRSAEDAYPSWAPDPTFAFDRGLCCPTLDFVIKITFYTLLTLLFCIETVSSYMSITLWRAMRIYHLIDTFVASQYRSTWWQRVKFQPFVAFFPFLKIENSYWSRL
jgi:hypothetical protein